MYYYYTYYYHYYYASPNHKHMGTINIMKKYLDFFTSKYKTKGKTKNTTIVKIK